MVTRPCSDEDAGGRGRGSVGGSRERPANAPNPAGHEAIDTAPVNGASTPDERAWTTAGGDAGPRDAGSASERVDGGVAPTSNDEVVHVSTDRGLRAGSVFTARRYPVAGNSIVRAAVRNF